MRAGAEEFRAVIRYLHSAAERRDLSLVRALHDELGGCMVSAAMDLSAVDLMAGSPDRNLALIRRAHRAINGAIDLGRGLSETLRPSLLDNLGLFAALRWYLQHRCAGARANCTDTWPETEPLLTSSSSMALYRIVQESLDMTFAEPELKAVQVVTAVIDGSLSIKIGHQHETVEHVDLYERFPEQMLATAERICLLGGASTITRHATGTEITHSFDLPRITR